MRKSLFISIFLVDQSKLVLEKSMLNDSKNDFCKNIPVKFYEETQCLEQ